MKNMCSKLICIFLSIIISLVCTITFLNNKSYQLDLLFYDISGKQANTYKIDVTDNARIFGYTANQLTSLTTITDKELINDIINYLNSIQLNKTNEKSIHSKCNDRCASVFFYDADGLPQGWIVIHGNVIQRAKDLKVFRTKNMETNIISELENISKKHVNK